MQDYPIYTLKQLGQVLRSHRKAMGKTQGVAGDGVGMLTKTVSALESNPGATKVASLFKLLSSLELDLILRPKDVESSHRKGAKKSPTELW